MKGTDWKRWNFQGYTMCCYRASKSKLLKNSSNRKYKKKSENYCSWQSPINQCKLIEQPYIIRIETIMQWRELNESDGIFKVIQCVALEPVSVNCWRTIPTGSIKKKNQKITVLDNPPSISANRLNNHTSLESML